MDPWMYGLGWGGQPPLQPGTVLSSDALDKDTHLWPRSGDPEDAGAAPRGLRRQGSPASESSASSADATLYNQGSLPWQSALLSSPLPTLADAEVASEISTADTGQEDQLIHESVTAYERELIPTSTAAHETESVNFPTIGSRGHFIGLCKPCAFIFKDGCRSGQECQFCHLCEPGTKKRRKKEAKLAKRSIW